MSDVPIDQPPTTALTKREKPPVAFGVAPATLEQAFRLAQAMANSKLVPKDYQDKPDDILVAILMGHEVGLSPMTAVQSIGVVNGKPLLYGDGLLGLVMASPLYDGHEEYFSVSADGITFTRADILTPDHLKQDTTCAVVGFRRKGIDDPFVRTFSVGDAKRAGLWTKSGTWQTYPQRMLAWRALDFAARAAFPDVLKGLRSEAEVRDLPPDDAPSAPVVRRKSQPADPPVVDVIP